ncbi:hypothetical protein Ancab_023223 [Ancistrocladus abbreviatus]
MKCEFPPEYDKSSATRLPTCSTSTFMPDQSSSGEVEKRRIKEEIVAEDVKRRELEAEVRMELMVERELAKQRRQWFSPSVSMSTESPLSFDFNFDARLSNLMSLHNYKLDQRLLKMNPVEGNFGAKVALKDCPTSRDQKFMQVSQLSPVNDGRIEDKLMGGADDFGGFGSFNPVEQRTEINLLEGGVKPGILTSSSGGVLDRYPVQRVGEVNPIVINLKEDAALGKLPFQRQPDATAIIEKSHNLGEVAAVPQLRIAGVKRKAETLRITSEEKMDGVQSKKPNKTWFCSLCEVSATSEQLFGLHLQGKKHKAKEAKQKSDEDVNGADRNSSGKSKELDICSSKISLERQNGLENDQQTDENTGPKAANEKDLENGGSVKAELNQQKATYYCKMCNVSLNSKAQMDVHNKGKKHLNLLQKNGEAKGNSCGKSQELMEFTGSSNLQQAKILENDLNIKRDGKFIVPEPTKLEEHETVESQNQNPSHQKGRYWCKMCDFRTDSEDQMNQHRRGKEHMTLLLKKGGAVIVVASMLK